MKMTTRKKLGLAVFTVGIIVQAYLYPWTSKDVAWFGILICVVGFMLLMDREDS